MPEEKQMLLFTYVRLAHGFSDYKTRLKSVQVLFCLFVYPKFSVRFTTEMSILRPDFKLSLC